MLELRISSCCTPSDQVITFGAIWSGIRLPVAARAAACVVGGTLTCSNPPPARNPVPLAHHAGGLGNEQVIAGFCSVCNCGGRLLIAKLFGTTSYAICPPPRMDHLPLPVGSHANPRCGPKLFLSDLGLRKIIPRAGSSAMAFSACFPSSLGTPLYS